MHNFMIADLAESAKAVAVFVLFLLPPGYVLGWTFNLLRFRDRSATERVLLSTVLSISASPLLAVLVGRFISLTASLVVFGALGILAALIHFAHALKTRFSQSSGVRNTTWIALGIMALWMAVVLIELVDLQLGHRLYLSVVSYDQSVRTAFVQAVLRTGVPPLNPFYFTGHAPVMRYFYYWYVLCALPSKLAGLTPRASLIASSAWSGFGLAATVALYLKHFLQERRHLRRKSLIGIGLLLVTGLDIIPTAMLFLRPRSVVHGDMEWWNTSQQVTSWLNSLLWVPHHVASLIACLTGFLVLWTVSDHATLRSRATAATVGAIAFASAAGLSVYVTFTFAVFLIAWASVLLWEKRTPDFWMYATAAAITILLSLPYLGDLRGPSPSGQGFAIFAVRDFYPVQAWLIRHGVGHPLILSAAKLPTLVLVYMVEFGFFLIAGVVRFRRMIITRRPPARQERAAWVMLGTALCVTSFLRSGVISNNDLGMRSALVVQFVLLLCAVPLVNDFFTRHSWTTFGFKRRTGLKYLTAAALGLGIIGTVYQLSMLRLYAVLTDTGKIRRTESFMPASPGSGERTYGLRDGYEQLERLIPADAVVQHNPTTEAFAAVLLYSQHQAAATGPDCGTAFGGDLSRCSQVVAPLANAFGVQEANANVNIDQMCDRLSINVLVASERDQAWQDNRSWVWNRQPIVANNYLRAIPCGSFQQSFVKAAMR